MPTAVIDSTVSMPPAGLCRRLAAICYDCLLLIAVEMIAGALWLPVFGDRPVEIHPLYHLYQAFLLLIAFAFLAGFWLNGGQTLGMRAWRLRLLGSDGRPPTLRQAAVRFCAAGLSWLAGGSGFLWSLIDPHRRTWHDLASDTVVVHEPKSH
jgi:uncharacterized RDD family membrane protein YckC